MSESDQTTKEPSSTPRKRSVLSTRGKIITVASLLGLIGGWLTAGITEFTKITVNAFAKAPVEVWVNNFRMQRQGAEQWTGIYWSPKLSNRGVRQQAEAQVSNLAHERGIQNWSIKFDGDRVIAAIEEDGFHWEGVGLRKNESIVVSIRGGSVGRGTLYLTRNSKLDYYAGMALLCDCQSPVSNAVMMCPYVLYNKADSKQAVLAKDDPAVNPIAPATDKKCTSIDAGTLHAVTQ